MTVSGTLTVARLELLQRLWSMLAPSTGDEVALAELKKAEKAKTLEDLFSDETKQKLLGVTAAQKARIEAWVPDYYD